MTMAPSGSTSVVRTTVSTTPFQPALQTQTKKPTARSIASSLPDALSNASEARYWTEKFDLTGSQQQHSGPKKKHAHPRKATLDGGSSAVIHQLVFDPSQPRHAPLAVVCGPRVKLYGTTPQSPFHRTLQQRQTAAAGEESLFLEDEKDEDDDDDDDDESEDRQDDHKKQEDARRAAAAVIEADRQISTGGHLALAASYRSDGRLLAIGTASGLVRIVDVTTRATLCTFSSSSSSLPIRATAWLRDGQHLLAAGDDGVLRVWQLAQGAASTTPAGTAGAKVTCQGHGDVIRSAVLWQDSVVETKWPYRSLAMTGSYDHTIRIWNLDNLEQHDPESATARCLSVLSQGGPVEALLIMPSSDPSIPFWLVSAGGTTVKVWNPLAGTCVSTVTAQHRKTITCLLNMPRINPEQQDDDDDGVESSSDRILTGGLDGLIRIHTWNAKTGELQLVHGIHLDVAITAMACHDTENRLAIGAASGRVLIRQKGPSITQRKRARQPRGGTYSFFMRGMNADAIAGDFIVSSGNKKRKLRKYDVALKQFRYGDALDEALETRMPQAVVAVLEELGKRKGLTISLSNRDEETLEPILAFTVRYISRPRFAAPLIGVANKLIDIYGDVSGQSELIDELFDKLKKQVADEARVQRKLLRMVGQLEAIMTFIATDNKGEQL